MIQNSLVIAIIAAAAGYVVYSMVKSLSMKPGKNHCAGCSGCDLQKERKKCCKQ